MIYYIDTPLTLEQYLFGKVGICLKKENNILYGTVGVCQVEGISKPDFSNNDKVYYSLVPKFDQDTTIYIPVDSPKVKMREIMTRQEAEQFILALPSVEGKQYANDKERPQAYRQILESGDCTQLASMIKEISEMEQNRRGKGKPLSIREAGRRKERPEAAVWRTGHCLDICPEEIPDYITSQIGEA